MMHFTQTSKPEVVASIAKTAANTITVTYESGKKWTIMNAVWSAVKNRDDASDPTGGYINFSQLGSGSGLGIVGTDVSVESPLTFDSTEYTNIETLVTHLLSVLV